MLQSWEARLSGSRKVYRRGARHVLLHTPPHKLCGNGWRLACYDAGVLKSPAIVDDGDDNDDTLLYVAAQVEHVELVRLLLDNHADMNIKNILNLMPLHGAVRDREAKVSDMRSAQGIREWGIGALWELRVRGENKMNNVHEQVFKLAVLRGDTEGVVDLLRQEPHLVDAEVLDHKSALVVAAERGYVSMAKVLLSSGADVENYHGSNNPSCYLKLCLR